MKSLAERLWAKVDKSGDCWMWTGAASGVGNYGYIGVGGRKDGTKRVHRVALQLTHGPILDDLVVCHRCDTPLCVRPEHLFLGTKRDNTRDMLAKGRARCGKLRGEQHGKSKVTAEQVREIRARAQSGETYTNIAKDIGVNRTTIGIIARRETWVHIA